MATNVQSMQTYNGTLGQVWRSGVLVAECTAFSLKVSKTKETFDVCGDMWEHEMMTGVKGTGSLEGLVVDSSTLQEEMSALGDGEEVTYTLIGKLDGKAGTMRVAAYNCSFDDMTLLDFKAKSIAKRTQAFSFRNCEILDAVDVG